MGIQIDIFGSVVCRDMIRYFEEDEFTVNRCIGGVPVSTLYERPVPLDEEELNRIPVSQYDKRMLKIQMKRNAVKLLKKSEADILVIDLADEAMKRYQYGRNSRQSAVYPDEMEEYIGNLFPETNDPDNPEKKYLPMEADMDMEILEKKYRKFAWEITFSDENPQGYPEENIVLIETFYAEDYVGNADGASHSFGAEHKIKDRNAWLKQLYGIAERSMPECKIIKLPMFTHASENHLRGLGPLYYTEETYIYLSQALGVLYGTYKKNSLDNLFKERGLKNKLYTRLLRCGSVHSIPGMKKQIKDLEQQVASLQKQLNELKKK